MVNGKIHYTEKNWYGNQFAKFGYKTNVDSVPSMLETVSPVNF